MNYKIKTKNKETKKQNQFSEFPRPKTPNQFALYDSQSIPSEEIPSMFYHKTLPEYEKERPTLSFYLLNFLPRQLVLAMHAIQNHLAYWISKIVTKQ